VWLLLINASLPFHALLTHHINAQMVNVDPANLIALHSLLVLLTDPLNVKIKVAKKLKITATK
jgi:hypothetical protein